MLTIPFDTEKLPYAYRLLMTTPMLPKYITALQKLEQEIKELSSEEANHPAIAEKMIERLVDEVGTNAEFAWAVYLNSAKLEGK